jgi:hypothetical protein
MESQGTSDKNRIGFSIPSPKCFKSNKKMSGYLKINDEVCQNYNMP